MRLVIRVLGFELIAIEQGEEDVEPWDSGVTSSVGYSVDPIPSRDGYEDE
jgi:hypothetical protein